MSRKEMPLSWFKGWNTLLRAGVVGSLVAGAGLSLLMPTPAEAQTGGQRVVLNIIWRQRVYTRPDLMSTNRADERDAWPSDGQVWYLPQTQIANTVPVYRLYNPNVAGHMDHMDSLTAGEGGYQTEWDRTLGYGFTTSVGTPGLTRLTRTYNPSNGDHGTRSANEGAMAGYNDETLNAWAWSRYPGQETSMITSTGGGVTLESNRVAGGAVWHWTHNGTQYINNTDYGRQLQAAIFFEKNARNPTEAGDQYTFRALDYRKRHGSPLVQESNWGSGQLTRAIPLEWNYWPLGGTDDNPVLWKDMVLGKNVQLNYNNMGPVAQYTTVVTVPAAMSIDLLHMPVAYLRGEFSELYSYDATKSSNRLTSLKASAGHCNPAGHYFPHPGFGGVIAARPDGTRAMGIYSVNRANGGTATHQAVHEIICKDQTGEFDGDTVAIQAAFVGTLPAGTSYYNAWIMTGTLAEVQSYMQSLYNQGVK